MPSPSIPWHPYTPMEFKSGWKQMAVYTSGSHPWNLLWWHKAQTSRHLCSLSFYRCPELWLWQEVVKICATFLWQKSVFFMVGKCGQFRPACALQLSGAVPLRASGAWSFMPQDFPWRTGPLKPQENLPQFPCLQRCTLGIPWQGFPQTSVLCCCAPSQDNRRCLYHPMKQIDSARTPPGTADPAPKAMSVYSLQRSIELSFGSCSCCWQRKRAKDKINQKAFATYKSA